MLRVVTFRRSHLSILERFSKRMSHAAGEGIRLQASAKRPDACGLIPDAFPHLRFALSANRSRRVVSGQLSAFGFLFWAES
jgi:hypothetical protein